MNQRWRERKDFYKPAQPIRTADYDVVAIDADTPARAFVELHHYSGSYPAARFRFGLYRRGELAGIAVFSVPSNAKALTNVFGAGSAAATVELGRFVLTDDVPGNGETWFLGQCFRQIKTRGITGILSFSDPVPRTNEEGRSVFPGHIGTIYQAHNATYLGRSTARTIRLLPDGRVFSARAAQKIRAAECGWRYAVEQLVAVGADPLDVGAAAEERRTWLIAAMDAHTRPLRHPGNYRYAWRLERRTKIYGIRGSYPKKL